MSKPVVAVFFGSRSTEHDVSIITALSSVIKPLELSQKYHVVPVYIAKDGKWYSDERLKEIRTFQTDALDKLMKKLNPLSITFSNGMKLVQSKGIKKKEINVDIAFPALHGTHGEDGEIMGLFEMADIAYVGCDMPSSTVSMDKVLTKLVASSAGLNVVPDVIFTKAEYEKSPEIILDLIVKKISFPAFVKPPHLGSSIGVTKVSTRTELQNAIEVGLTYDWRILVEMAVPNLREATLPIIGNGDKLTPAFLEEPLFKAEDFFDFDTKYMSGGKKGGGKKMGGKQGAQGYSKIPADFKKSIYEEAEKTALTAYKAVGCGGTARVDILIDYKKEKVYFNEINPMPGSIYAHNWQKKGISNVDLVCRLIDLAVERQEAKKDMTTTYSSSFLKQF